MTHTIQQSHLLRFGLDNVLAPSDYYALHTSIQSEQGACDAICALLTDVCDPGRRQVLCAASSHGRYKGDDLVALLWFALTYWKFSIDLRLQYLVRAWVSLLNRGDIVQLASDERFVASVYFRYCSAPLDLSRATSSHRSHIMLRSCLHHFLMTDSRNTLRTDVKFRSSRTSPMHISLVANSTYRADSLSPFSLNRILEFLLTDDSRACDTILGDLCACLGLWPDTCKLNSVFATNTAKNIAFVVSMISLFSENADFTMIKRIRQILLAVMMHAPSYLHHHLKRALKCVTREIFFPGIGAAAVLLQRFPLHDVHVQNAEQFLPSSANIPVLAVFHSSDVYLSCLKRVWDSSTCDVSLDCWYSVAFRLLRVAFCRKMKDPAAYARLLLTTIKHSYNSDDALKYIIRLCVYASKITENLLQVPLDDAFVESEHHDTSADDIMSRRVQASIGGYEEELLRYVLNFESLSTVNHLSLNLRFSHILPELHCMPLFSSSTRSVSSDAKIAGHEVYTFGAKLSEVASFTRLCDHYSKLANIVIDLSVVIGGGDEHLHDILAVMVGAVCLNPETFDSMNLDLLPIPSSNADASSALCTYLAYIDPIYRRQIYAPFTNLRNMTPQLNFSLGAAAADYLPASPEKCSEPQQHTNVMPLAACKRLVQWYGLQKGPRQKLPIWECCLWFRPKLLDTSYSRSKRVAELRNSKKLPHEPDLVFCLFFSLTIETDGPSSVCWHSSSGTVIGSSHDWKSLHACVYRSPVILAATSASLYSDPVIESEDVDRLDLESMQDPSTINGTEIDLFCESDESFTHRKSASFEVEAGEKSTMLTVTLDGKKLEKDIICIKVKPFTFPHERNPFGICLLS